MSDDNASPQPGYHPGGTQDCLANNLIFATTLGIGVLFSALSVIIYQGTITCAAGLLQPLLEPTVVSQMSAVGGLLIVAIGINMLEIKVIRVGNMLPAIFIPLAWFAIKKLAGF